jgi:hypothetical protein
MHKIYTLFKQEPQMGHARAGAHTHTHRERERGAKGTVTNLVGHSSRYCHIHEGQIHLY